MKNNKLPQKKTGSSIQNNKEKEDLDESLRHEMKIKEMEFLSTIHKNSTSVKNKGLDTINNLSNNKLASKKLELDAKQKGIDNEKMFNTLNKAIDKKFSDQDRAMDNAEKTLDKALDRWDKDVIMKSLDKLADVANTNPLGNNLKKEIKKEITLNDFDDDDNIIEM